MRYKLLISLVFVTSYLAQAQTAAVDVKQKCNDYLKDAWSKCTYNEKVGGGYKLSSCSDLKSGERRLIVYDDFNTANLSLGRTCMTTIETTANAFRVIEETASGAKLILTPKPAGEQSFSSRNFIANLVDRKGNAFAYFDSTGDGTWRARRADGTEVVIPDHTAQNVVNGMTYSTIDEMLGFQRNEGPAPTFPDKDPLTTR